MKKLLLFAAVFALRAQPQPPCGSDPIPPYAALNAPPNVKVWNASDLKPDWKPPACTGWNSSDSPTVVALAARFHFTGGIDGIRRRIGAVSDTKGMLYWSATQKRWQALVLDAHASTGPESDESRADFSLDEVAAGRTLYFQQEDNLFGSVHYRLRIRALSPRRMVFDVENAGTIKYLVIPLFDPGQAQSLCYLEQESSDVWKYYALLRTSGKAAALVPGHEASAINRAVAVYRRLAGIPGDQEPPASR